MGGILVTLAMVAALDATYNDGIPNDTGVTYEKVAIVSDTTGDVLYYNLREVE